MCAKLFKSITAIFLFVNVVSAQNLTADASTTNDSDYFSDYSSLDRDAIDVSISGEEVYYDIPVQVSKFDWRTKSFEVAKSVVKYTKAEVLDELSNETLKTVMINESNRSVDMSDIPSGSYYLILTNDSGEVHSEKIVII